MVSAVFPNVAYRMRCATTFLEGEAFFWAIRHCAKEKTAIILAARKH